MMVFDATIEREFVLDNQWIFHTKAFDQVSYVAQASHLMWGPPKPYHLLLIPTTTNPFTLILSESTVWCLSLFFHPLFKCRAFHPPIPNDWNVPKWASRGCRAQYGRATSLSRSPVCVMFIWMSGLGCVWSQFDCEIAIRRMRACVFWGGFFLVGLSVLDIRVILM